MQPFLSYSEQTREQTDSQTEEKKSFILTIHRLNINSRVNLEINVFWKITSTLFDILELHESSFGCEQFNRKFISMPDYLKTGPKN